MEDGLEINGKTLLDLPDDKKDKVLVDNIIKTAEAVKRVEANVKTLTDQFSSCITTIEDKVMRRATKIMLGSVALIGCIVAFFEYIKG